MEFSEDAPYLEMAEAYALDAVDYARENMRLTLDWTEQSIQVLESILDRFNRELAKAKPTDEQVGEFSRMWGSYLGEVYRKNHGATWGLVTHGDQSFPGMKATSGTLFWPWGRVQNRLRNGPEDNVWHYYLDLTGQLPAPKAD
ncbi:MAG TPA: hypothetical protein VMF32_12475 [Xanthobacteraceae bacterium]|nr:hypothetical protein [Xanthobacteraceae bacterium]